MTEKTKQQWETLIVYYDGKKLKKKGGEGDKAWKLYTVEIKLKSDAQYTKKCSMFGNAKGSELLNEDREGGMIKINCLIEGYKNEHGNQISRKIVETSEPDGTLSESMMTREEFHGDTTPDAQESNSTNNTQEITMKKESEVLSDPEKIVQNTQEKPCTKRLELKAYTKIYKKKFKDGNQSFEHYVVFYMKLLHNKMPEYMKEVFEQDSNDLTKQMKEEYYQDTLE